jgi:hypothetical protein
MVGMDWSQISVGALLGAAGQSVLAASKTAFEHWLETRRQREAEARTIRAEMRAEASKEEERRRAASEQLAKDEAILQMYKTQLKGTSDLVSAGALVGGIHSFFIQRPHYLSITVNRSFLERYPQDFREQAAFAADRFPSTGLAELKVHVDTLHLR